MPRKKLTEKKQPKTEKPLTLSQLLEYHHKLVEPRFNQLEKELREFREEATQRFDDLYKKFEDLRQEYVFTNVQFKRLEQNFVSGKEFHLALAEVKDRIDMLQQKLHQLEQRI